MGMRRTVFLTLAGIALLIDGPAPAWAASPTPSPGPSPTSSPSASLPGSPLDTSTARGFVLFLILLGVLVLVWFIPYMVDLVSSNRRAAATSYAKGGQVAQSQEPTGTPGLVRALMALTVITIAGVALLLVLSGNTTDATDLRKTLITAIATVVGAISGFYFGGKTAESAAERVASAVQGAPTLLLTPSTADFTPTDLKKEFTLSNNSSAAVTVAGISVSDAGSGFFVNAQGVPPGVWDGRTASLQPSEHLGIQVGWDPPPGPGPFPGTLTVAHTGAGAPSARLTGTKP
jgi:hypothetical protein